MSPLYFFFVPLLLIRSSAAVNLTSSEQLSAYDILKSYNLPVGLLPKGATGYDLDPDTGKFTIRFSGTCEFKLEAYQIRYKSRVSGRISDNTLQDLKGVSVRVLLWINIVSVTRRDEDLEFSVGIVSADFPIENFEIIPQCGCGLDCDDLHLPGNRTQFKASV